MKWIVGKLLGDAGERQAVRYLKRQGYRILGRQQRSRFGELDIVALDRQQIVFVEVKTRRGASVEEALEAVTPDKQRRIVRAARAWLKERRQLERSCRFDVVAVIWTDDDRSPTVRHVRHAFEAPGKGPFFG